MTPNILQEVFNTVRGLSEKQQREVLEYARKISASAGETNAEETKPEKREFIQKIEELMSRLPKDAFKGYPTDGSLNHDHYLYGSPKREIK